jgi:hypothetical protein
VAAVTPAQEQPTASAISLIVVLSGRDFQKVVLPGFLIMLLVATTVFWVF